MKILVTGAAGFIGSVVTERLLDAGHAVVATDDLRYGHRAAVDPRAEFALMDVADRAAVDRTFAAHPVEAVVHLAAEAYIDESILDPGRFYLVNVTGGLNLLEAMRTRGVRRMLFSSTAAVYGQPEATPITEEMPHAPVNAYGETKLAFERAMGWYHRSFGLNHVSFRYFNACGATAAHGEDRKKETHLIPILFDVAQGKRASLSLFGTDYPTPDGTCVRDYVHVLDIAQAHLLALERIDELGERAYNLGSEGGNSNREVIEAVRRVTGHEVPVVDAARRPGDPAVLVASSERIRRELGWKQEYAALDAMVESAWRWRAAHPTGYPK